MKKSIKNIPSKNLRVKDMDGEVWKLIPGYDSKYWVSNLGRVRLLNKRIKRQSNNKGYLITRLSWSKGNKIFSVHQLVAMAFLGHNLDKRNIVVNHKNGIRNDNNVENLEVVTQQENILHAIKLGLHNPGYWKGKKLGPNPTKILVTNKINGKSKEYPSIKDFCVKNKKFVYGRVVSDSWSKTNFYENHNIERL